MRHIRLNFGRYLLCFMLFACGLAAFSVATMLDWDYWSSVARTDMAKLEYGGGAVIFRTVTFLFAAVVALQWRTGKLTTGLLACLVLSFFAAVGMSSVVGFGSRERIVPYNQAMANAEAQKAASAEAKARKLRLEDEQIAFLREQARNARGPQSRQVAYDALGTATFGTTEVIAAPKIAMASDPQAEAIHAMFPSVSVENVQLWTTLAFGIGLILAEQMCVAFGVGLWPRPEEPALTAAKDEGTVIAPISLPSAEVIHPPQFAREPEPEAIAFEPSPLDLDVHAHLTSKELVREFWKNETTPCPGNRILASAAYRAYISWCEENDYSAVTQQMFGRISGTFISRFESASWYYCDRALSTHRDTGETQSLMVA